MAVRYLVDTNIAAAFFMRQRAIVQRFRENEFIIPSPVVGEMYTWAYTLPLKRDRLQHVRILLSIAPVLQPDIVTGERYGLLYNDLQQRRLMILINDIWIAALALQHGYTLATRDNDFSRVTGLKVEYW